MHTTSESDRRFTFKTISALSRLLYGPVITQREQLAATRELAKHEAESVREAVGVDFRVTVIEALVSEGLARHVAAEWTNTPDKLDAQADRLNLS